MVPVKEEQQRHDDAAAADRSRSDQNSSHQADYGHPSEGLHGRRTARHMFLIRVCNGSKGGCRRPAGRSAIGRKIVVAASDRAQETATIRGRIREEERRLKEEVKRLLEQAEAADAEEKASYARDRRGDELPAEWARREARLKRIQEAKRALEERAPE
jgi:hypothetical protein